MGRQRVKRALSCLFSGEGAKAGAAEFCFCVRQPDYANENGPPEALLLLLKKDTRRRTFSSSQGVVSGYALFIWVPLRLTSLPEAAKKAVMGKAKAENHTRRTLCFGEAKVVRNYTWQEFFKSKRSTSASNLQTSHLTIQQPTTSNYLAYPGRLLLLIKI
ncbi:hypothetical protein [Pontibacter beigongshangensis]|uniref:hypothetical protein n=1 Tax=Pontibacter beigongshangensis TaxID=2574733 RepID=UPI0016508EAA|nr:hypothetical protein [Pontibacter beigongshangensis]